MYYVPGPPLSDFVALFWYFQGHDVPNAKRARPPHGERPILLSGSIVRERRIPECTDLALVQLLSLQAPGTS